MSDKTSGISEQLDANARVVSHSTIAINHPTERLAFNLIILFLAISPGALSDRPDISFQ